MRILYFILFCISFLISKFVWLSSGFESVAATGQVKNGTEYLSARAEMDLYLWVHCVSFWMALAFLALFVLTFVKKRTK